MLSILAIAWVSLVIVLLFRAITQYAFYEVLCPRPWGNDDASPPVTVIIPARNEAHNIERCLNGLLHQDYPNFSIIVVNDNSTDETANIVQCVAKRDSRVHLVQARPLPEDWTGKAHACWQGALRADGNWLCFVDADTVAAPALLSTAMYIALHRELDMLSLEPFQKMLTVSERLVIPAGFFLLAFCHDVRRVNDPDCEEAAANGQFLLFRRNAYHSIRGHAAVRSEVCEDTALARLMKRMGRRLSLLGAETLIQTRMYTGFRPLWEGLSKNVVEMIGGYASTAFAAGLAIIISAASLAFPVLALQALFADSVVTRNDVAAVAGGFAALILYSTHVAGARHFGIPWWYGFLFPIGYLIGALIACNSILNRLRGRVTWKGRVLRAGNPHDVRTQHQEQRV